MASTTSTATNADGGTTTKGATGKGGVQSGKDGIGAYGEGSGSAEKKGANGVAVGAVAGLNANVSCNIKQIPGEIPPKYVATTRINLGASIKGSAGYGKEGGAGKAGASVSGSATVYMNASPPAERSRGGGVRGGVEGGRRRRRLPRRVRDHPHRHLEGLGRRAEDVPGDAGQARLGEDLDSMQAGDSKTIGRKTAGGAGVNADVKGDRRRARRREVERARNDRDQEQGRQRHLRHRSRARATSARSVPRCRSASSRAVPASARR